MLVRPRLTDYYDLPLTQETADFAIPFLDEDIPLYVDPFLLWKSPAQSEKALHTALIAAFNGITRIAATDHSRAIDTLIALSECQEIGLGAGKTRSGRRIGRDTADEILRVVAALPDVERQGIEHVEILQLYIDQISKDRISDFTCSFLKSHLIDYTIAQASAVGVPMQRVRIEVFDYGTMRFTVEELELPVNPLDGKPLLFVPKRWLRYAPWISFDDFFVKMVEQNDQLPRRRVPILTYNRANHALVSSYLVAKERQQSDCQNDPLFRPIPIVSARKKLSTITKLPTGKDANADKLYESAAVALLASLLYPHLDFAAEQSRTDSGVLIRDLVFYNGRSVDFLKDIYELYGSRQLVFEMKNVHEIEREHINQLNRYLSDEFGRCGFLVTRRPLPTRIRKNVIDLWSAQRRAIITLTDEDLALMVSVFESKQRQPYEVMKRAYIEFTRLLPS
jgi:hypothetical protein